MERGEDIFTSTFNYLKGPEPVAAFQKVCGVTLEKRSDSISESDKGKSVCDTVIKRKWLYWLFLFGTSLGDETFYSVFFTFWFWSVDGAVGRRVVAVWAICMYIGICNLFIVLYNLTWFLSGLLTKFNFLRLNRSKFKRHNQMAPPSIPSSCKNGEEMGAGIWNAKHPCHSRRSSTCHYSYLH